MWVVVKSVNNRVALVVDSFKNEEEAQAYANNVLIGSLGYEKWEVFNTQKAKFKIQKGRNVTNKTH